MESLSFSATRLRALFNEGLGFRVLDSGMENQMIGFYPRLAKKNFKAFQRKLESVGSHGVMFVFHLMWKGRSCPQLCHWRFGRVFKDRLKMG